MHCALNFKLKVLIICQQILTNAQSRLQMVAMTTVTATTQMADIFVSVQLISS